MRDSQKNKNEVRQRRHHRIRAKIKGTEEKPRLSVYRSLKHICAQLIDDIKGATLVAASDLELISKKSKTTSSKNKTAKNISKTEIAYQVGQLLAQKALALPANRQGKKIEKVVFDKGWYKYHGRVKALAEGARKNGLRF